MDFSYTEEQKMLADAVRRYAEKEYATHSSPHYDERRRREQSQSRWRSLADMGLLGLMVDAEYGGLEKSFTDAAIVMHEFGRGLINEPYAASCLAVTYVLQQAASSQQKDKWLRALVDGSAVFALAVESPEVTNTPTGLEVRNGALYGEKVAVLAGDVADWLIVPARCSASRREKLFCIPISSVGLRRHIYPNLDGQTSADVCFEGVLVQESDELQHALNVEDCFNHAVEIGQTALCAEAWGLLERVFEQTLDHLQTRKQFGTQLANFQVLQHRCVEMLVSVEQAQSVALMATAGLSSNSNEKKRRMVSASKAQMGRYIRRVTEQATQLVGGMGMTQEFTLTHYIRRLLAISMTWGNTDAHVDLYNEASK